MFLGRFKKCCYMGHVVAHHIVETRGRLSLTRLVAIIIIIKKDINDDLLNI